MTSDTQVGERPVRYGPRSLTALAPESVRGWTVKRYGVSSLRDSPGGEVLDFARLAVGRSLPVADGDGPAYGYSVVHEDEDGCYVVVGWWSRNGLILHSRTWLANWADLTAITPAPGGATACVWELVAVGHERDAWVRHVLRPAEPDFGAYVASTVSGQY
ncbi:hypothetical protein [Kitasatospora sp. MAP5-34]|uniref:hypothetical protein n=1 Tax=Kitasatospora sp. MAP5-34 TaxID=3035102 RepID=UPI00247322E0|nr:hypothetical protein [Kitasatospora sp. MAP5-34]MDH6580633.1 hypothetical protein [Kitasatospora sp. MAP5-34]